MEQGSSSGHTLKEEQHVFEQKPFRKDEMLATNGLLEVLQN